MSDQGSVFSSAGREQVGPYNKRTRLFTPGEVFPGVTAVPSLGHTPGIPRISSHRATIS